jgi:hypothetical protein
MFGIDDIIGAFTGGGGSSSSSVTSNVNLKVEGLDKMGVTLGGGDKPVALTETVELKPLTVNLGGTDKPIAQSLELKPVTLNENIDLKPVTLNENIDLEPVTLNENIDLKPVAVDTCQTFKLAPLPETGVRQPYHHHVGYTMFGMEYMGVTYRGESQQLIDSPQRPQVIEHVGHELGPGPGHGGHHRAHAPSKTFTGERGIRVRVLEPDD